MKGSSTSWAWARSTRNLEGAEPSAVAANSGLAPRHGDRSLLAMGRFVTALVTLVVFICPVVASADVPVHVTPVVARDGIVVAGHPQAADAGITILQAGGNAIDAAVATSLALGVAEPYGSGLGGKLMLLYYEAK